MTIHGAAETGPAIVLRTRPLGESDLLVVLLTPEHGKVEAAARGARNSKRRFPGGLPSGLRGLATLARGRGALARLERFEATVDHAPVGRDLDRFAYVAYLCELTDELVLGRHPDAPVFAALCTALAAVIDGTPRPGLLRCYELALLRGLGLLPALVDCCACGEPVGEDPAATVAFDAGRGGALCPVHGRGAPRLPGAVLAAAQRLVEGEDPAPLDDAPVGERRALRDLTQSALKAHLRRPLRSLGFFAALARPPSAAPDAGEDDAQ